MIVRYILTKTRTVWTWRYAGRDWIGVAGCDFGGPMVPGSWEVVGGDRWILELETLTQEDESREM